MGIRVFCPNGHRLNLKRFLAGKRGICPHCGTTLLIPTLERAEELGMLKESKASRRERAAGSADEGSGADVMVLDAVDDAPGGSATIPAASGNGHGAGVAHGETQTNGAAPRDGDRERRPEPREDRPEPREERPAPAPAAEKPLADPIAENPQAVWYVRTPQGGQYGPAAGDIMRKWIADGRVQPDFWVWREGWADWQKASASLPDLSAGAPSAKPSTPVAAPARPSEPAAASLAPVASPGAARPASTAGGDEYVSPRAALRPRRRGGIHPMAALAVVGLGLICLALLGVLVLLLLGVL